MLRIISTSVSKIKSKQQFLRATRGGKWVLIGALVYLSSFAIGQAKETLSQESLVQEKVISVSELKPFYYGSDPYRLKVTPTNTQQYLLFLVEQNGADVKVNIADSRLASLGSSDIDGQIRGTESVLVTTKENSDIWLELKPLILPQNGNVQIRILSLANENEMDSKRIRAEKKLSDSQKVTDSEDVKEWKPKADLIEEACQLFESLGMNERLSSCLMQNAWLRYGYLYEMKESEPLARRAIDLITEQNKPLLEATALRILGDILVETPEKIQEGEKKFNQALKIQTKLSAHADAAWTTNSIGYGLIAKGERTAGIEKFDFAQKAAYEADAEQYHATALKNYISYAGGKDISNRISLLENVSANFLLRKQHRSYGLTSLSLGNLYLQHGSWEKAIQKFHSAKVNLSSHPDKLKAKIGLARAYLESGNPEVALSFVPLNSSAKDSYAESSTQFDFAKTQANIVLAQGNIEKAKNILLESEKILDNPQHIFYLRTALAKIYILEQDYGKAMWNAKEAIQGIDHVSDRHRHTDALLTLAESMLHANSSASEIRGVIEKATLSLSNSEQIFLNATVSYLSAVLEYQEGNIQLAKNLSEKAVKIIWQQRFVTSNVDYRSGFLEKTADVYEHHARILASIGKQSPIYNNHLLLRFIDGIRARNSERDQHLTFESTDQKAALIQVRDQVSGLSSRAIKNPEEFGEALLLQDLLSANSKEDTGVVGFHDAPKITLETEQLLDIQANLPNDTLIVSYWLREGASHVWYISKREISGQTINEPRKVETLAKNLHDNLSVAGGEYLDNLKKLKNLVVPEDLRQKIQSRKIKHLLVVPDKALHFIPPPLLFGDHISSSTLASISDASNNLNSSEHTNKRIAIFGNASNINPSLATLPAVEEESNKIAEIFLGYADVYTAERATRANFINQAHNYDVIHVATHASYNASRPLHSGIIFSESNSEATNVSNNFLTISDIRGLKFNNSPLLVLSACSTAFGRRPTLEGYSGFPNAFLAAGVKSVLVSLWNVPDSSASELMQAFYKALVEQRLSANEALLQAQMKVREKPWQRHPIHWAGWLLVEA